MITRGRLQLVRERVQLQNQIESLLEEGRIKLSSVISDLLGVSGRRILRALGSGETNPETLAALGDEHLKCGWEALVDALTGAMVSWALQELNIPGLVFLPRTVTSHKIQPNRKARP